MLLAAGVIAAADEKPAIVAGAVLNSLTGEPLPRAHVVLRKTVNGKQQPYGAIANAEGKFSLTGLPAGSYTAAGERTGFVMPLEHGRRTIELELAAGERKDDFKLRLAPVGAIAGQVTGAGDDPVERVTVVASDHTGVVQGGTTDDKGQFRIDGLPPGKYRLKAVPVNLSTPPEIRPDGTVETHYVPTYYPNALEARGAARVEVGAGAEVGGAGIRLVQAPVVRVSGRVIGMPAGARDIRLEVRRNDGSSFTSGGVKPDGSFERWRMDPGPIRMRAFWAYQEAGGRHVWTAPAYIEIGDSNVDRVELRVVAVAEISGQVEFEEDRAKPRPADSDKTETRAKILLAPVDGSPAESADLGADGVFHFIGLAPDRYRVLLSWPGAYVKSVRLGPTAMAGGILDLRSGSGGAPLSLFVSAATGEISGTVRDDQGAAAEAQVALVADDREGGARPVFAMSGRDGAYHFTGVAPGTYKVTVVEENDQAVARGNLDDYEAGIEKVEIQAGDRIVRDLKRR